MTLGPFGLDIHDAVISFGASAGLKLPAYLSYSDMLANSVGSVTGLPKLGGSAFYELNLPIELSGVLAGISDGVATITASSQAIPDNASLGQFFASIPSSMQFDGLGPCSS